MEGGIAVDSSGNVYVADTWNNRIQKFDSDGNFITKWAVVIDLAQDIAVDSRAMYMWLIPIIARIQKFDSDGNFITKWSLSAIW